VSAVPAARRLPLAALALAALLAGCERAAGPGPCPGEPQARLELRATLVEGELCAGAIGVERALRLPATIAFAAPDEAALCPDRALAEPLVGARAGDAVDVAAPARAASVEGCACSVVVVERVRGTLVRDAAGAAVGFEGELVDELAAAGGLPACAAAPGEACAVPCVLRWRLAAP
jgi:hypothetical protein